MIVIMDLWPNYEWEWLEYYWTEHGCCTWTALGLKPWHCWALAMDLKVDLDLDCICGLDMYLGPQMDMIKRHSHKEVQTNTNIHLFPWVGTNIHSIVISLALELDCYWAWEYWYCCYYWRGSSSLAWLLHFPHRDWFVVWEGRDIISCGVQLIWMCHVDVG